MSHPSASLYVGDLEKDVTEGLLYDIFKRVGTVNSIRVCRDSFTNRSLGYAYVNFQHTQDADRALATLNNTAIKTRPCRIMWSQRDPSVRRSGVGNVFIKNLDAKIGHKELHDTFSQFGNILSCKVATDKNGESKGYGFVHFETQEEADNAINLVNGNFINQKEVYVGKFIARKEWMALKELSWTNVYIKNLDGETTEDDLRIIFEKFGTINSVVIMRDNESGDSRKFGFTNFVRHDDAVAAVDGVNGTTIGTAVNVYCSRAQKKSERASELKKKWELIRRERINKYAGVNLYIKNIEDHIDEERLQTEFEQFGEIESVKIMRNERKQSRGFGFVCFKAPDSAQRALNKMAQRDRILPGCTKPLYVNYHEPKEMRAQRLQARYRQKGMRPHHPGFFHPGAGNVPSNGYPPYITQPPVMSRPQRWGPNHPQFNQPMPGPYVMPGRGVPPNVRGRFPPGHPNQAQPDEPQQLGLDQTLEQVISMDEEGQRNYVGERLFNRVGEYYPELKSRITGMFLNSGWSIADLYDLLVNEEKLRTQIEDSVKLINQRTQREQENRQTEEPTDVEESDK